MKPALRIVSGQPAPKRDWQPLLLLLRKHWRLVCFALAVAGYLAVGAWASYTGKGVPVPFVLACLLVGCVLLLRGMRPSNEIHVYHHQVGPDQ
jgi:hypothetical protein